MAKDTPAAQLSRKWRTAAHLTLPCTSLGISGGLWTFPHVKRLKVPPLDQMRLIVNLAFLERHEYWSDGRQRRSASSQPGALRIAPLYEEASAEVRGQVLRFAQIYIPTRALLTIDCLPSGGIATSAFRDPGFNSSDTLVTEMTTRLLECGEDNAAVLYRDHLSLALLSHLQRQYGYSHRPPMVRGGLDAHRLRIALELLNDPHVVPNLSTLSSEVGLSQFHFTRSFRRSLGVPPYVYLREVRINRAKRLLTTTDFAVTQVALDCGYSNPGAFSTAFFRSTGVSPSAWRKQNRR